MRFAWSLAEQGFGSILTFAVNLWLIRNGAPDAYGAFVFWLSVAWVSGVAQGTLVLAHLSRLPSAHDHAAARRTPERLMLTVSLLVLAVTAAVVAGGDRLLAAAGSDLATPAAALFVPAFLLFQYARTLAFSRQRPGLAAGLTGTILLLVALLLLADHALGDVPTAGRVLLLSGFAYGGVSAAVVAVLMGRTGMMLSWREVRANLGLLHGSAWLMLGAGSNEVTARLYSFVTVGSFGTAALASLSAVQVVIRPAWLLSAAWTSVGFPDMSARFARGDRAGLLRTLALGGGVTAVASLAWSGIVLAGWPWISAGLYGGKYPQVGPLIYLWGANVVIGSVFTALNVAVLAVGQFRSLAMIDFAGALMTVGALAFIVSHYSYPWCIVATLMGQTLQLALMAAVLLRRLRHIPIATELLGPA